MRFFAFFRTIVPTLRLAWRLFREPRVSLLVKMLPVLGLLYVVDPLDLVPDVFPLIGELDDLVVVAVALQAFVWVCPSSAVQFHRKAIAERRPYSPMKPTDDFIDV